jgi:hypothetical protein
MNMIGSSPRVLMAGKKFWQFYYDGPSRTEDLSASWGAPRHPMVSRSTFSARRFRDHPGKSIEESISTDYQLWKGRGLSLDIVDCVLFKVPEYNIVVRCTPLADPLRAGNYRLMENLKNALGKRSRPDKAGSSRGSIRGARAGTGQDARDGSRPWQQEAWGRGVRRLRGRGRSLNYRKSNRREML